MKLILAILLGLCAFVQAARYDVTVSGVFDDQDGSIAFPGAVGKPFELSLSYDTEDAFDWVSRDSLAIFYFPLEPITLRIGEEVITTIGVEARVYSGESGLYGITFGNRNALNYGEAIIGDYQIYASFTQVFDATVAPTDALAWWHDSRNRDILTVSNYFQVEYNMPEGQGMIQSHNVPLYTSQSVPEPSTMLLLVFGIIIATMRPRPRV